MPASTTSPVSIAARRSMPVPISGASVLSSGTAWRCMFEPISARLASSCSRNGIIAVATDQICSGETSIRSTSVGLDVHVRARERAAEDRVAGQLAVLVSGVLACAIRRSCSAVASRWTISSVTLPFFDDAVGRRDEAVLGDLGVARQRADQADVRALRRLDRAHAAVVGRVDVAHLDRRALAREAARAERGQAPAVRQARERVRLVHELRQLRGAEELLQRGHDRADVDDRLRRDRVRVLGGEALADDALHAVEADPEGLLDQLADGAQTAVAEVLVLVEVVGDGLARARQRLGRVVLDLLVELLGQAEQLRQRDELLDQGDDVVVGQGARLEVDVEVQARVELVAADAREVVALGVEEELVEQVARVVDARRLARALLLEQLDQRAFLGLGDLGVGVDRVADVDRVVEEVEDLLVARVAHRAQQHRDRQLALAVDADEDLALLVDLELQPGAAGRHQVADEDLLLRVLGLHQVGARGTDELRDDDALGAVDDEGAALGHPREVAHEDGLLADLAGLPVDEADRDGQRARVGEVLLTALVERRDGRVELELPELDGEVAGVVLDRRDVVDRLAQAPRSPCRRASRRTSSGCRSGWGHRAPCPGARSCDGCGEHQGKPRRRLLRWRLARDDGRGCHRDTES